MIGSQTLVGSARRFDPVERDPDRDSCEYLTMFVLVTFDQFTELLVITIFGGTMRNHESLGFVVA
jgi:hypothetical protein